MAGLGLPSLAIAALAGHYWLASLTSALAIGLASRGVGLLYGQLGLVSLCQYALIGVGGWIALRLDHAFHPPFEVSLVCGGVVASLLGVAWGLPALRVRGLYLALVTLMLAGTFQVVILVWGFPDGGAGFFGRAHGAERVMMSRPVTAAGDAGYFLYAAAVVALGFVLLESHRFLPPGRAWALIRKDERMAQANGVDAVLYKAWAFALAGFCAGVAGGLLAGEGGQLDGRAFPASQSITLFALSVVGGTGTWVGAMVAGLLLQAVPALLDDFGVNGYLASVVFGAALLHALTAAPDGLAAQLAGLLRRPMRTGTPAS